jgi:hypothetical protein
MSAKPFLILTLVLLCSCSAIPYKSGESNSKLATDLKIAKQDIKIISKCNFYPFEYGVKVYAKMRECVFINEGGNLIFVGYDNSTNRYEAIFKIDLQEVNCAAIADKDPGRGIVYLYIDKNAFTVALLHDNNDLNHEAVRALEKELERNFKPILDLSIAVANPLYRYKTSARSACPLLIRSTAPAL